MKQKTYKSWIEISREALVCNIEKVRELTEGKEILAVVKANAYGHGIEQIVDLCLQNGIAWFGVDNIDEALQVKELVGLKGNILILGYVTIGRLQNVLDSNISLTVYNQETIDKLGTLKGDAKVHVKVETGMNRQGVGSQELIKLLDKIKATHNIILEGISTHFAEPEDLDFTSKQIKVFNNYLDKLEVKPQIIHTSASVATIQIPDSPGNMVRIGKAIYGFLGGFVPVLSWKSLVAQVKIINKEEYVGYGHTWRAPKETIIAIVPIGYADGFDRKLSNKGRVLIRGQFAKVVGRVAMNMIAVDISHIKSVKIEDEVVIIGTQGKNQIKADDVASQLDTIAHEVLSRLNSSIPKIII